MTRRSDERLRLLFMLPSLQGGGAERVAVSLLREIDRKQFDLTLVVFDARDAAYRDDVPSDVEVVVLDCPKVRLGMAKIIRLLWKRKPDIVFSTLGHLNLALAIIRPVLPNRTRYVARETTMVSLLPSVLSMPLWWNWAYRRFLGRLDVVVCQSESMRNDLIQNLGLPGRKAVVINNPVDVKRIRLLAAQPVDTGMSRERGTGSDTIELVAAGTFERWKGFDLLVEALALCRNSRLRLTLLGDGPLREDLHRLSIERGLAAQIRFVGFQKNPYPYLAQADALVLSSRFEGFPNVVLEALACGTPVIATPSPGGVSEILERVDGCALAKSVTAEGLGEAIQRFSFGHRLPAHIVAPYAVEAITRRYESVFAAGID